MYILFLYSSSGKIPNRKDGDSRSADGENVMTCHARKMRHRCVSLFVHGVCERTPPMPLRIEVWREVWHMYDVFCGN